VAKEMKLAEISHSLSHALLAMDKQLAYDCLLEFHEQGGEQFDAYELLKELRKANNYDEDFILELMDVVSGWCGTGRRIWENTLGSRVCLYTVEALVVKNNNLALLPGIQPNRIREYDLGWLTEGVELELHYPDGTVKTATIANYDVNALEVYDAPKVICVELPECVPLGTRIWNVRRG
jgi:hypothetical protein